jgi:hypothetical protein
VVKSKRLFCFQQSAHWWVRRSTELALTHSLKINFLFTSCHFTYIHTHVKKGEKPAGKHHFRRSSSPSPFFFPFFPVVVSWLLPTVAANKQLSS